MLHLHFSTVRKWQWTVVVWRQDGISCIDEMLQYMPLCKKLSGCLSQKDGKSTLCTCEHKYTDIFVDSFCVAKYHPSISCCVFLNVGVYPVGTLCFISQHSSGLVRFLTSLSVWFCFCQCQLYKATLGEFPGLWAHLRMYQRGVVVLHQTHSELLSVYICNAWAKAGAHSHIIFVPTSKST